MNSFAARCLGAGVAGPYSDVMHAMRSALEDDLSTVPKTSMIDCKTQIACEWISNAVTPLLWWARENVGYNATPDDQEDHYVEGGVLYSGPPAICLQRWAFWLGRFDAFGKDESAIIETTQNYADETAQFMRTIESSMATTFLEYRPGKKGRRIRAPEPSQAMYTEI